MPDQRFGRCDGHHKIVDCRPRTNVCWVSRDRHRQCLSWRCSVPCRQGTPLCWGLRSR